MASNHDQVALGAIVFFHAHPDDEAIFTGGTMARLAAMGWRVVLVVATGGELGLAPGGHRPGVGVAGLRRKETLRAAEALGVARVEFLGYLDSGLEGDPANRAPGAFCRADPGEVADRVRALLREEAATALVIYDDGGIYGHPDHLMVHRAGSRAADGAEMVTLYEATVDREYLHFVETHLVEVAKRANPGLGLAASALGSPTVLVDVTVDVSGVLDAKKAALAAHASQIPETTALFHLPAEVFGAVYGFEWYLRRGLPGPIDALR